MSIQDYLGGVFDVAGRTAVVTGGGSGIGKGMAVGLAAAGARVFAVDMREDYLDETVQSARDLGAEITPLVADVTDEEQIGRMFDAVEQEAGAPHAVFGNAGIGGPVVPGDELTLEAWHRTLAVNLDGAFITAREAYRRMKPRGSGKIVLTASVWGIRGTIDGPFTAYAASKGAVWNLVHQLAVDMAEAGVTVNGIAPAGFHTRVADNFYDTNLEAVESLRKQIPSGRIVTPDAMIGPALFLASSASDHVNGHVLAVDGGYLAK